MLRRNVRLIVFSLLVGPAIGGATFLVLALLYDLLVTRGDSVPIAFWPVFMLGAYVLGAVPALLTALAVIVLTTFVSSPRHRILLGTIVGAVLSPLALGLPDFGMFLRTPAVPVVLAAAGGLSAFLCLTFIERRHPLPAAA